MTKSHLTVKTLAAITICSSGFAQEANFSGYSYGLRDNDIRYFSGTTTETIAQQREKRIADYQKINAELQSAFDQLVNQHKASLQLSELREQTELLRKIANQ